MSKAPRADAHQALAEAITDARKAGGTIPCLAAPTPADWTSDDPQAQVHAARACQACPRPVQVACRRAGATERAGVYAGRLRHWASGKFAVWVDVLAHPTPPAPRARRETPYTRDDSPSRVLVRELLATGPATTAELVEVSGLSPATVQNACREVAVVVGHLAGRGSMCIWALGESEAAA